MPDIDSTEYQIGLEAVKLAYTHKSTPGRSALAYFCGQATKDNTTKRRKSGSHQVYAAESRQPQFSRPVLPEVQELTGFIHREIASLTPICMLWVQYRYRKAGASKDDHALAFMRAYTRLYDAQHLQSCRTATRLEVFELIRVGVVNAGMRDFKIQPNRHRFTPRNWNKTYKPHWQRITQELRDIDQAALSELGRKTLSKK